MLSTIFDALKTRRGSRPSSRAAAKSRRFALEALEERQLLTSYMMVNSAQVQEGNVGLTMMPFNVRLTAASLLPVTAQYQTSNGPAIAGVDYDATSGTLTISAGQTASTIQVPVIGNTIPQLNRTFKLTVSNPANAVILGSGVGTGTIIDDDAPVTPALSINNPQVHRGLSGTTQMIFTVSLNTGLLTQPVTVTVTTADCTAVAGIDYVAKTQVLTFNPGVVTQQFVVTVYGNATPVGPKVVYAKMSAGSVAIAAANGQPRAAASLSKILVNRNKRHERNIRMPANKTSTNT